MGDGQWVMKQALPGQPIVVNPLAKLAVISTRASGLTTQDLCNSCLCRAAALMAQLSDDAADHIEKMIPIPKTGASDRSSPPSPRKYSSHPLLGCHNLLFPGHDFQPVNRDTQATLRGPANVDVEGRAGVPDTHPSNLKGHTRMAVFRKHLQDKPRRIAHVEGK